MAIINTKDGEELLVLGVIPIPINSSLTNSYKASVRKESKFNRVRHDANTEAKPEYELQIYTDYTINLEVVYDGGAGSEVIRLLDAFVSKYSAYVDDKKEVEDLCTFDADGNSIKKPELTTLGKLANITKTAYEIGTRASYVGRQYLFFDLAIYNILSLVDENDPNIMLYTISCSDEYNASAGKNTTTNIQILKP